MQIRVKTESGFESMEVVAHELTARQLVDAGSDDPVFSMISLATKTPAGEPVFSSADDAGERLSGRSFNDLYDAVDELNGVTEKPGND